MLAISDTEFTDEELKVPYIALNMFVLDGKNCSLLSGIDFGNHYREALEQADTLFWRIEHLLFPEQPF